MKIGELGKTAGCAVETIRYYEQQGLLPAPARSEANYRLYRAEHLERLLFIRNCRALDMSLEEISRLIALSSSAPADCTAINHVLDEHLAHVQARISSLQALQTQLQTLRQSCQGQAASCPIVEQLTSSEGLPAQANDERNHLGHSHRH